MTESSSRIVSSALGPRLTETLRQIVGVSRRADPLRRVTVITPSFFSSFYLRRALAPFGLFNVEFLRVDELAELLAAQTLHHRASRPLGRLEASELVHSAAIRSLDDTTPLGRIRQHEATQRALHATFTELAALEESAVSRFADAGLSPDLIRTFRTFRQLSEGFHDRRTVARAAADVLDSGDAESLDNLGQVVVLLVEAPPPQYRPLWSALARHPGAHVVFGQTGEPDADNLIAESIGTTPGAEPANAPPLPRLISAATRADEIRQVVREVVAAAGKGVRLNRIAVFHADTTYGLPLKEAFELAGIATCGPDPSTMGHTPGGRFLDGIFRIIESDFSRDAVTGWLTSAPVVEPDSGAEAPSARWDAVSRAAGITVGSDTWQSRLEEYAKRADVTQPVIEDEEPSAAEFQARSTRGEIARRLARFVHHLENDFSQPTTTWRDCADWLKRIVGRYLRTPVDDVERGHREWLDRLIEKVAGLDDLDGIELPSPLRLSLILRAELERPLRASQGLGSGVFIASLGDAAGTVFDVAHIVGMREGLFPPPNRIDPLLPDAVRERLDAAGFDLPTGRVRLALHRRRFLAAMAAAGEVVLYWPRSESGSVREDAPSPWFIEQVRRHKNFEAVQAGDLMAGRCGAVTYLRRGPSVAGAPDHAADVSEYDTATAALWSREAMPVEEFPLPSEQLSVLLGAIRLISARNSDEWTRHDGNLSGLSGGFAAPEGPVSATRFEKYAACPFRYFLGELAKVEPTEKPEDQLGLTALARGSLVHSILEAFIKQRGAGREISVSEQRRLLLDMAEIEFRKFELESPTGHPALWELEKRSIARRLTWWLESDAVHISSDEWVTCMAEKPFGMDHKPDSFPAVVIPLDDGRKIEFRGVIDRLDLSADGRRAAVFDYKTGSTASYKGMDEEPLLRGTKLQLAVYGAAVRQRFPSVQAMKLGYWFVFEDPGKQLLPSNGNFDFERASAELVEVARVVSDGISSGLFPARPGGSHFSGGGSTFDNCAYCEYDNVCTVQRQRQWSRKNRAPSLRSYVDLTGDLEPEE